MNPFEIRIMTLVDYDAVRTLWQSTAGMGMRSLDDSYAGIERFLTRNPETCFIAERDGSVLGAVLCGHDGRRAYVYHLAVAESARRQGIGSALVQAMLNALEKIGIHKAALVVYATNTLGNAFWASKGFGVRDDLIYRDSALTLENQ